MKNLILVLFLLVSICYSTAYSQLDKPSFQLSIGISEPQKDLRGDIYQDTWYNGTPITNISRDFITNNYGAKTGFSIFGLGKINFDKYDIFRGVLTLSYSNFNTFQGDKSTMALAQYRDINNNLVYVPIPVTYSYNFNNFGIGLGVEIAPIAFTNVISPFIGANFNFNFLSAGVVRTMSKADSLKANFTSFRLGANLNAGLEFKVSKQLGFVAGWKYEFANLLLKSSDASLSGAVTFGRDNLSLNDNGGTYFSSIFQNIYDTTPTIIINSKQKDIQWWTAYIGVNYYLNLKSKRK